MWQTSQDRHRMSNVVLQVLSVWPGGVLVRALDLRLRRSLVRLPVLRFQVTTLGKLFTHTRVPLSRSSIIWYRSRSGDVLWPGRSGVALAMRHRLPVVYPLTSSTTRKGDERPAYTPRGTLYFFSLVLTTTSPVYHTARTSTSVDNVLRRATYRCRILKSRVWDKIPEKGTPISAILKFSYNSVWDRSKETPVCQTLAWTVQPSVQSWEN